jgi:probable addiction module antidote protein
MERRMLEISRWDASEHLRDQKDITAYIDAAFEDGDPEMIQAVLGDIAKAIGMSEIARRTGIGRASLYKALSKDGSPSFKMVAKVTQAVGLQLRAEPAPISG